MVEELENNNNWNDLIDSSLSENPFDKEVQVECAKLNSTIRSR